MTFASTGTWDATRGRVGEGTEDAITLTLEGVTMLTFGVDLVVLTFIEGAGASEGVSGVMGEIDGSMTVGMGLEGKSVSEEGVR